MLRKYEDKVIRNYEDKAVKKKTFFIIASGPSLSQSDVDAIRGKGTVIVINDNYLLASWADILYFCDPKWFKWHQDKPEFKGFKGKIYTQDETTAKENGFNYIKSASGEGLSTDPNIIYQGSNSGYQAINLAYHLGAERIILLGYDMQSVEGKWHWFGDHPDRVRSNYHCWTGFYNRMAEDAEKKGLQVINCTRKTALTCFPIQDLNLVLSEIGNKLN